MDLVTQKKKAKEFVKRWKAAEGNEQREANSFWTELCQEVLGIPNPTHVLDFERKVRGKRIDVFYEDHSILIENKSRGVDLDKKEQRGKNNDGTPRMVTPYEQARWYADYITPRSVAPKYILTCNFDEIRIYDTDEEYPERTFETIHLEELPNLLHRLSFFTQKENSRAERETNLSVSAGEVVGKLYDAFSKSYLDIENNEDEQRSLNMLITRIVFLLYAEDSGNLKVRNQFYNYMSNYQTAHMRNALRDLFLVLNTEEDKRDPYLPEELADFPYINGGLFKDEIIIPQFTDEARYILLKEASSEFDWANISPTIFGAVFESTLTAKKRREGGMHYTSVENIHKVTGPLFYDDLKNELTTIEGIKTHKERQFKLRKFREKLASFHVLDPACGSGNFLTETYLSFRKLENRVLEDLRYDQVEGQMTLGQMDPIMVSLDQFYGIEIDDFAVSVAKTALWIAQLQMTLETSEVMGEWIAPLPLKSNENIVCGNALRIDWNDVLPAEKCDYIIGNPPFLGSSIRSKEQTADLEKVFVNEKKWGKCDYCVGWYRKAASYMTEHCKAALVSTNSITQGEQVEPTWRRLFDMGVVINFAWKSFIWNSESIDQAHVHCVIIGFSFDENKERLLFDKNGVCVVADNINGYLVDASNEFVPSRCKAVDDNHRIIIQGCKPVDGGGLILTSEEKDSFVQKYPELSDLIHLYLGAAEFINDKKRYCFWLKDVPEDRYIDNPIIKNRLKVVTETRENSPTKEFNEYANRPHLFVQDRQPSFDYLIIPQVSGERRKYIPVGYLSKQVIVSNLAYAIPNADYYDSGLVMSEFFNAWMRTIAGRLKSDYRFSPVVYNTMVYPNPSNEQKEIIVNCVEKILRIRESYIDVSLAEMYDGISPLPEKPSKQDLEKYDLPKYKDLLEAHQALDAAVEAAYGVDFQGDEEKIVAHLFKLYEEAIRKENGEVVEPEVAEPKATGVKVKVKRVNKQ